SAGGWWPVDSNRQHAARKRRHTPRGNPSLNQVRQLRKRPPKSRRERGIVAQELEIREIESWSDRTCRKHVFPMRARRLPVPRRNHDRRLLARLRRAEDVLLHRETHRIHREDLSRRSLEKVPDLIREHAMPPARLIAQNEEVDRGDRASLPEARLGGH